MDEKSDNNDELTNIDKRYELLHAARDYTFDSFLVDVDYKKTVLLNKIDRKIRLHPEDNNLRAYFSVLALVEKLKVMLRSIKGKDRFVFDCINEVKLRKFIKDSHNEFALISNTSKIGDLYLAIILKSKCIKNGFSSSELHPYFEAVFDEGFEKTYFLIHNFLINDYDSFRRYSDEQVDLLLGDFSDKVKIAMKEINDAFELFAIRLNSIGKKKTLFERRVSKNTKSLHDFTKKINESKGKIKLIFDVSFLNSAFYQRTFNNEEMEAYKAVFESSISNLNERLRRSEKFGKFESAFHVLKSSKFFGLYSDSYLFFSFDKEEFPFSVEQINRLEFIDSEFIKCFKKELRVASNRDVAIEFNRKSLGKSKFEYFFEKLRNFRSMQGNSNTVEQASSCMALINVCNNHTERDSEFRNLQRNFEFCSLIDEVKFLWSKIVKSNIKSNAILMKRFHDVALKQVDKDCNEVDIDLKKIDDECNTININKAAQVLIRDVFEIKDGKGISLTRIPNLMSEIKEKKPTEKVKLMNYKFLAGELNMKPFFEDKSSVRNRYNNSTNFIVSPDDEFQYSTKRKLYLLKYLKLNILLDKKPLEEIRVVKRMKYTYSDPEAT